MRLGLSVGMDGGVEMGVEESSRCVRALTVVGRSMVMIRVDGLFDNEDGMDRCHTQEERAARRSRRGAEA